MTAEWTQVRELFEQLVDLDPEARAARLADPEIDPVVVREVRSLLTALERVDSRLAPPRSLAAALGGNEPEAGDVIGAWRLERPIGQGGMGTVWSARRQDGAFEMTAALKLIKRGLETDAVLARFRRERQLLADLDHRNIARLLDGGRTPDGRPWLAMEYVDGRPIDQSCRERGLGLQARLSLFAEVCDAVAAAHRRGIVHRDLKPGNILVGEDGAPKLLDFGIAKVIAGDARDAEPTLTRTGERPLTPRYAAPEQLLDEPVGPWTDVYALGVILFELLVGESPYGEVSTLQELQDAIVHRDPVTPSTAARRLAAADLPMPDLDRATLGRRLRGDLDVVCLTALRREPERRYRDAAALATDVRRHLAGEAILARRESLAWRARRYASRHRVLLTAASGIVAVSLAAAAYSARAARIADDARDDAQRAQREAVDSAANARAEQARAEQLFESLLGRSTDAALTFAEAVEDVPGTLQARGDLLDSVIESLDELHRLDPDHWAVRQRLAVVLLRRAQVRGGAQPRGNTLGPEAAFADFERAAALARGLEAGAIDDVRRRGTRSTRITVLARWASALLKARRDDDAEDALREATAVGEEIRADPPVDAGDLERVMTVQATRARAMQARGESEAAIAILRDGVAWTEGLLAEEPESPHRLQRAAAWRSKLAAALDRGGDKAAAIDELEVAVDQYRRALDAEPDRVSFRAEQATSLLYLGRACADVGRFDASIAAHEEGRRSLEDLLEREPENVALRRQVGWSSVYLAVARWRRGAARAEEGDDAAAVADFDAADGDFERGAGDLDALAQLGRLPPEEAGSIPMIRDDHARLRDERAAAAARLGGDD